MNPLLWIIGAFVFNGAVFAATFWRLGKWDPRCERPDLQFVIGVGCSAAALGLTALILGRYAPMPR